MINPNALLVIALCTAVGWALGYLVIGLIIGLGIILVASIRY